MADTCSRSVLQCRRPRGRPAPGRRDETRPSLFTAKRPLDLNRFHTSPRVDTASMDGLHRKPSMHLLPHRGSFKNSESTRAAAEVHVALLMSTHQDECLPVLKRGGDVTSHTERIITELYGSAQVVNNKLFEQPSAEPFSIWWRNRRTAAFFPIQVQHLLAHSPTHTHMAFRA